MNVPDRSWYDPVLDAYLHTGDDALGLAQQFQYWNGTPVAIDIETPGLARAFEINCVTAAWNLDGKIHAILLDPVRNEHHFDAVRWLCQHAGQLILHNAPFDVPPLAHHSLISLEMIDKIVDTLLLARFAEPDTMTSKKLESCVKRHLGMDDFAGGMALAFKAAGYRTIADGYEGMDIESSIYRVGAMADTVQTLRLEPILRAKAIDWTLDHPFIDHGAVHPNMAAEILSKQETVNRVMLRRSAVGLAVDTEYLTFYAEKIDQQRNMHIAELAVHGLEGGMGKGAALVQYLFDRGELPSGWPRTRTGKLSSTKDDLQRLDHPAAQAQRQLAETDKIMGYLEKVYRQAEVTGRCHPQVGVLGASATGRMAYSSPELQQFPKDARPIIADDGQGLTSIDWSQIEPVTMALMAKDDIFLAPFEAGEDLYEPIQRSCGVDRDLAKVVLLATMYGQGPRSLGARIGHTEESAAQIRRQMLAAMPRSGKWMSQVQQIADIHGRIITAGGRILPVDPGFGYKAINFVVQGSAYDVLAHTICEMDRLGIGDHIQLAMHDEVVVDTQVAEQVQQIMMTPPPFLTAWAGREPVLRTDRADMGASWAKV
jgi:DNA polymerase-1